MPERIAWIGGNQRRHLYYINEISKHFEISGGVMMERTDSIPTINPLLSPKDQRNWTRHFWDRLQAEGEYFGDQEVPKFPLLKVNKDELNTLNTADFIRNIKPDIVLVFGTGMIREPLMSALPKDTINLHLGLSPRYRGAATLFWPFYMLEPNWAGSTFHYIVDTPDGGDIIHQVTPDLSENDGIHDVACKTILKSTIEAVRLLETFGKWKTYSQKPEAGKNFLESDFKPQHLRMIYNVYDNDMVRRYLKGELTPKPVKTIDQFK